MTYVVGGESFHASWEGLTMGEKVAALYSAISSQIDSKVAASFLAALGDLNARTYTGSTPEGAEIPWRHVKAAFEQIALDSDLDPMLHSIEEKQQPGLVSSSLTVNGYYSPSSRILNLT